LGILVITLLVGCDAFQNFTGHKLIAMVPRNSEEV
ncbi:hypothetical protein X975_06473, partial [Stegodyphus mimosarum]